MMPYWTRFTVDIEPPPDLDLDWDKEVHLWRLPWRASEALPAGETWTVFLTAGDHARLARISNPVERMRRATGRGFLRGMLSYYSAVPVAQLPLSSDVHGRPILTSELSSSLEFSLSYARDWVVLACTRCRRIGVDIEAISNDEAVDELVRQYFSAREITAWEALSEEVRREAFFAVWARKEAYLKALGVGLLRAPSSFSVTVHPLESARLVEDTEDLRAHQNWWLSDVHCDDEHRLTIALAGLTPAKILCFQLEPQPPPWVK